MARQQPVLPSPSPSSSDGDREDIASTPPPSSLASALRSPSPDKPVSSSEEDEDDEEGSWYESEDSPPPPGQSSDSDSVITFVTRQRPEKKRKAPATPNGGDDSAGSNWAIKLIMRGFVVGDLTMHGMMEQGLALLDPEVLSAFGKSWKDLNYEDFCVSNKRTQLKSMILGAVEKALKKRGF